MKVEVTRDENGIHFEIKDDGSAEYQKAWNIVKDANAKEQESSGTGVDSLDGGGTLAGMEWISVNERLPEERVRVLTCGDDPVEGPFTLIGFWEPASKFGPAGWHLPCFAEFGPVTHWMPLPEPPEVK